MSWQCGECSTRDSGDGTKIDAMCHHCGKPLCKSHRKVIVDDAFGGDANSSCHAFHCEECLATHHPRAVPITT